MPTFSDFYFTSSTGINRIRARRCMPDREPRAIVQIVHGISEHMERYDDFARFLADNGFVVVGTDHLGHGKSIAKPEERGFFAESNGWSHVVADLDILREGMRREFPDLPYIFFGHSMGSFLTRTYLIKHPYKLDAAIISGTGHQSKALVYSGATLAEAAVKTRGTHAPGHLLNKIAFGSYNKGFSEPRTNYDWLSRDTEMVDDYIADPLCGFVPTVSLFRDMMNGIKFITAQENIDKMRKDTPIYFMSGDADPVGENGAGVKRAYDAFLKAGMKDVFLRLYPYGRHEMLNELNRAEVYSNILKWLNAKLP